MGAYVYSLILVGVCAAVVEWLTLGGEGSKMTGHLRMVTGLCILIACLQPIGEGITYLKNLSEGDLTATLPEVDIDHSDYNQMFNDYMGDMGKQEITTWIEQTMQEVFGISAEDVDIDVVMDTTTQDVPTPAEVYLSLSGKAILKNPHQIESYIASRLMCPCYVSVGH